MENEFLEEEDKTEPQLKEFFKDLEDGDWSLEQDGIETLTENKKLKKGIKTIEEQKFPIQNNYNRKNQNTNNYYESKRKGEIYFQFSDRFF